MNALELISLNKSFGAQKALDDICLSVPTGSRTVIVGPSGSGKTTLLRMIAGFEFPDAGSLTLNGQVLVDSTHAVPAYQRQIGYVPQDGALFPHMTVAANIGFGLTLTGTAREERIKELMDSVSLDANMANRWPHELSGGQQQRVSLARALAQQPRLMLLDEPFSALDTGLRSAMRKMVARLLEDAGVTTILVTHDQGEALSFADQLAVMRGGRLVPVNSNGFIGNAQIMLRPEQLQLSGAVLGTQGCPAVVTERDFAGNTCTLTVELRSPVSQDLGRSLLVRSSGMHAPPAGSDVQLSVLGAAHVFAIP
jgi:iron(III) transport system ATP-binding protein